MQVHSAKVNVVLEVVVEFNQSINEENSLLAIKQQAKDVAQKLCEEALKYVSAHRRGINILENIKDRICTETTVIQVGKITIS